MHNAGIAKARRQVLPWYFCMVAVQHGFDEQLVVFCSGSGLSCLAGQQTVDALSGSITEGVSFGHGLYGVIRR